MVSNSDPNEASRKTLDEIRREIDAEFGFAATGDAAPDARDVSLEQVSHDRRQRNARAERRIGDDDTERDEGDDDAIDVRLARFRAMSDRHKVARGRRGDGAEAKDRRSDYRPAEDWTRRDEADDDAIDARLAHYREISARRHLALGRHGGEETEGRERRSGYLVAGLVGCVVGQAVLFAFLIVTHYGARSEVPGMSAPVSPRSEEVAPAAAEMPPAAADSQFSPETRSQADEPPAERLSSPLPPAVDLPPRAAPEPRASSSRQPAIISAATVSESAAPRVAPESRPAKARQPAVAGARDVAESQAQVRAALNEWLRTSARGGAPVQTTEPVIVLGADGRTAKTYVSVVSPIGLIPRQQRWELGARGWTLIDDRQAGLPTRAPANISR